MSGQVVNVRTHKGPMNPVCVKNIYGWCVASDPDTQPGDRGVRVRCGWTVAEPLAIERREPDCPRCCKAVEGKRL